MAGTADSRVPPSRAIAVHTASSENRGTSTMACRAHRQRATTDSPPTCDSGSVRIQRSCGPKGSRSVSAAAAPSTARCVSRATLGWPDEPEVGTRNKSSSGPGPRVDGGQADAFALPAAAAASARHWSGVSRRAPAVAASRAASASGSAGCSGSKGMPATAWASSTITSSRSGRKATACGRGAAPPVRRPSIAPSPAPRGVPSKAPPSAATRARSVAATRSTFSASAAQVSVPSSPTSAASPGACRAALRKASPRVNDRRMFRRPGPSPERPGQARSARAARAWPAAGDAGRGAVPVRRARAAAAAPGRVRRRRRGRGRRPGCG